MFFSKSNVGFYLSSNNIDDAVEITKDHWQDLLAGQARGKIITSDAKGYPILIDPPKPDFKDVQAAALVRVENYHAQQVQALVGNPTQVEKDTWAMKLETANSIIYQTTLSDAGHAFLISAGLKSDDDQKNWAQSVVAKSVRYSTYVGVAERLRDTARAAVRAAENEEALKIVMDEQQAIAEQTIEALKQG